MRPFAFFNEFKEGRQITLHASNTLVHPPEDIATLQAKVAENRRVEIQETAEGTNLGCGTINKDLKISKRATR